MKTKSIFIILFLLVYITYSILEKAINIKSPTQLEFKIIDIIVGAIYGLLIFTFLFYISLKTGELFYQLYGLQCKSLIYTHQDFQYLN